MKDALESAAALSWIRAHTYGDPENIEEAIYRCHTFLRLPSINDFHRDILTSALATLIEMRSGSFGVIEGLQEALSCNPGATFVPLFSGLVASLLARSTTGKTHWWVDPEATQKYYRALAYVCDTTDIAEMGEAIKLCVPKWSSRGCTLGKDAHALKCTDKIEYLNESVVVLRGKLKMSFSKGDHFIVMDYLTTALAIRSGSSLSGVLRTLMHPCYLPP